MYSEDDINFMNQIFMTTINNNNNHNDNLQNYLSNNINGDLFDSMFNDMFNISDEMDINGNLFNDMFNIGDGMDNNINLLNYIFHDPIEEVFQESLNMQSDGLEKTDHIIKINSSRYETLSELIQKENNKCSICISDFDKEDKISITNCNHIFHTDCITEWGKYNRICPICRNKLE